MFAIESINKTRKMHAVWIQKLELQNGIRNYALLISDYCVRSFCYIPGDVAWNLIS